MWQKVVGTVGKLTLHCAWLDVCLEGREYHGPHLAYAGKSCYGCGCYLVHGSFGEHKRLHG